MNKVNVYDLDGTLSKLNNTFDFMYGFHKRKNKIGYLARKLLNKCIDILPLSMIHKRRYMIGVLYYGQNSNDLAHYFDHHYKKFFLAHLTHLGNQTMKQSNQNNILLTGCPEYPAIWIAKLFNFGHVFSTQFSTNKNKIEKIAVDTFGNFKLQVFTKQANTAYVYYTDDRIHEKKISHVMDEVIYV